MRIDLICEVIDNFGDAGISWRLARQLAAEWRADVRLFIDRPDVLARWHRAAVARDDPVPDVYPLERIDLLCEKPAELVIVMLGTTIPMSVRTALAAAGMPWLRYEYLSAEPWIDGCHGLPSIKPQDGAVEWFYYPGYTPASGGLLRESTLADALVRFREVERTKWLRDMALASPAGDLRVCLFGYAEPLTGALVREIASLERPCTLFVNRPLAEQLSERILPAGKWPDHFRLRPHDWLDQSDFDRLLASCDLSLVRGEDSWVRAQWTGRPFLWQAYRQEHGVHRIKLQAWLDRMLADASPSVDAAVRDMMLAINEVDDSSRPSCGLRAPLRNYIAHLDAIETHHGHWRDTLLAQRPLVERLVAFARDHLQLPV